MNYIQTKNAPSAIGPYSQAIEVNSMIFTSGQIALSPAGELLEEEILGQTKQVLLNLTSILEAAGSSLTKVVKTTIYLSNMNDFVKVNEVYAEFFKQHKPARSTVAVKTLPKNVLIEIDAIAIK